MRKIILLFVLCYAFTAIGSVSDKRIDSLKLLLPEKRNPADRVPVLLEIASLQVDANNPDSKQSANLALLLALSTNKPKLIATAYEALAKLECRQSQLDSGLYFYTRALQYLNSENEAATVANITNEIGIIMEQKGAYTSAVENYYEALRIYEKLNDKRGISNEFLNIGLIHMYRKEYDKADGYFNKALELAQKIAYSYGMGSALNNLGISRQEQRDYRAALLYFEQVLALDNKHGEEADIASTLNNMGAVYAGLENYNSALNYYFRSADIKVKIKDYQGLANTYNNIGVALYKQKAYAKSESYLTYALKIGIKYGFQQTLVETYRSFYELRQSQGQHKEALQYYTQYRQLDDSLTTMESNLAIRNLENQYQLDKANSEIQLKNNQIKTASQLRLLYIIAISLLLVLCGYFYYSITRVQKLNQLLNRQHDDIIMAKEMAEQANKAKSQFLSVMSHEIRTPLNAIVGIANLLEEEGALPEHQDNISVLKSASQNLLYLINDLLDLNKLEAGKMHIEKAAINVKNIGANIQELFAVDAANKGIELYYVANQEIPDQLVGDETKILQTLTNLVSNAIKFTERGKVNLSIQLLNQTTNQVTIRFSVSDTGIGIAADQLANIFQTFTQASPEINKKYGGTGLGLAISKRLVELMGGTLQVESVMGKGSEFSFEISCTIASDQVKKEAKPVKVEGQFTGKRILVTDDNTVNLFVLRQFLQKWGVEVFEASNGQEAINKLMKQKVDLVLMDLQMPVMDGIEATRRIRSSQEPWHNIPIIAITASHEMDVQKDITDSGMNDQVFKPFDPSDLMEKLKQHFNTF
jgi:signal transduction histidine kinase/ActR/RegA family two-component response regulator